jgi:hypothetical protein
MITKTERRLTRKQWINMASEQYCLHGVSLEKARLWSESLLNNNVEAINDCPYLSAEKCFRS